MSPFQRLEYVKLCVHHSQVLRTMNAQGGLGYEKHRDLERVIAFLESLAQDLELELEATEPKW